MKNFKSEEFACTCCGVNGATPDLMNKMDKARSYAGVPFRITSGFRCTRHNEAIGSTSDVHPRGMAADIYAPNSMTRFHVISGLIKAGFTRIGVGKDFVHGDVDTTKSPNVAWTYYD